MKDSGIRAQIAGKQKTVKGRTFKYYIEPDNALPEIKKAA